MPFAIFSIGIAPRGVDIGVPARKHGSEKDGMFPPDDGAGIT